MSIPAAFVRIIAICRKEVLHLIHDRLTFGMVIMIPLFQLVLFGYTINTDVRHIPTAVVDNLSNGFSRQLIMDLGATQILDFTKTATSPQELEALIQDGTVGAGLYIPHDGEQRHYDGERAVA